VSSLDGRPQPTDRFQLFLYLSLSHRECGQCVMLIGAVPGGRRR
jgi:hypothetical protein